MIKAGLSTSNAFLPVRVSALNCWYAADRSAKTLEAGSKVSSLNDLSSNARTLIQGTDGERPVWTDNALNNLPAFVADGADSLYNSTANPLDSISVYVVFESTSIAAASNYVFADLGIGETEATNSQYEIIHYSSKKIGFGWEYGAGSNYNYTTTSAAFDANDPIFIQVLRNNSTKHLYLSIKNSAGTVNEDTAYSDNNSGGTTSYFTLMRLYPTVAQGLVGNFGEFALFSRVISSIQQTWMTVYLTKKWGI